MTQRQQYYICFSSKETYYQLAKHMNMLNSIKIVSVQKFYHISSTVTTYYITPQICYTRNKVTKNCVYNKNNFFIAYVHPIHLRIVKEQVGSTLYADWPIGVRISKYADDLVSKKFSEETECETSIADSDNKSNIK